MKKFYLLVLFAVVALAMHAQPAITLTAQVDGNSRTLEFNVSVPGTKLQIDWGDGNLVETENILEYDGWYTTAVTGTPSGDGVIRIYGDHIVYLDCSSRIDGAQITSLDLSNATELQYLYAYTNSLSSLDLSKNTELVRVDCYNNPITELDLSSNVKLTRLTANDMSLVSIDLSRNTALTYLTVNNNTSLSGLDLSSNTALTSLYALNCGLSSIDLSSNTALTYVSLNNNRLTSLDVTSLPNLGTLMCTGNELTDLKADNVTKSVNCSNNNFTFSTLPALNAKTFTYVPQKAMTIADRISVNGVIDLSSQAKIQGLATEEQSTVYTWKTVDGTELVAGEDYTEEDGVFTFLKVQPVPVYCEMTTAAFPKFTGVNVLKTTEVTIAEFTPAITLTAQVDGNPRTLEFNVSVPGTKLQIDWGDGNFVETETILEYDGWYTTAVTGTPSGDGVIRIYGDHIVYLDCSSRIDGAQITSLDLSNATELQYLYAYTNSLSSLDLSKNTELVRVDCYNNPITELDLSSNVKLTRLTANDMSLVSLDLSRNTALTYLTVNNNTSLSGLDLSSNTALTSLYALNCGLSSIDLSSNTALTYVSLNNNRLTSLDVTSLPNLGTLMCTGNELTDLKADNVTKSVNCSNNNFTFSTLPALNAKTFTYVPQKAMTIEETVYVNDAIDLSSQNHIKGLAEEEQMTIYTWKTTAGTVLVAGEDYSEDNGVFTFLKAQSEPVYCEMTTDAFPKFTGVNALKTTEVLVQNGTGITETGVADIKVQAVGSVVKVSGPLQGETIRIYDMTGVKTVQVNAEGGNTEISLSAGIYVVMVKGLSYKVIVR